MEVKNNDLELLEKSSQAIYYSNSATISVSLIDFQLRFIQQSLEEKTLTATELCKIFMSPQHAKIFSKILSDNIAKYEQRFGEIRIPDSLNSAILEEEITDNNESE